jgi:hypothetical protein
MLGPVGDALMLALALLNQTALSDGAAAGPRLAPTLDPAKGKQAVAAYVAAIASRCKSRPDAGADQATDWPDVGIRKDASVVILCDARPRATAVASGALLRAGVDEVLLDVASGQSRSLGEDQLVVMRAAPGGYRFERAGTLGNTFEARARVTTPAGRDVVLLCERAGHAGLYPLPCGFFGQGHFSGHLDRAPEGDTDLRLGSTTICGPIASLALGKITVRDGHLVVEIAAEEGLLEGREPGDPETACKEKTIKSKKTFSVSYAIGVNGARRLTPIPREVREIARRFDF